MATIKQTAQSLGKQGPDSESQASSLSTARILRGNPTAKAGMGSDKFSNSKSVPRSGPTSGKGQ